MNDMLRDVTNAIISRRGVRYTDWCHRTTACRATCRERRAP